MIGSLHVELFKDHKMLPDGRSKSKLNPLNANKQSTKTAVFSSIFGFESIFDHFPLLSLIEIEQSLFAFDAKLEKKNSITKSEERIMNIPKDEQTNVVFLYKFLSISNVDLYIFSFSYCHWKRTHWVHIAHWTIDRFEN